MAIPSASPAGLGVTISPIFPVFHPTEALPKKAEAKAETPFLLIPTNAPLKNGNILTRRIAQRNEMIPAANSNTNYSSLLVSLGLAGGAIGFAYFAAKKHPLFLAASLLLGTGACVNATPGISYSDIEFNKKIAGDLRPSNQIEQTSPTFFNSGKQANTQLSEFYPNIEDGQLSKIPTAHTFWLSRSSLQERGFNLSWELVLSGFQSNDLEQTEIQNARIRGCAFPYLENPETGNIFLGNENVQTKGFVIGFSDYTVGLQVCPTNSPDNTCTLHDVRNFLPVDDYETKKNIGCFLNGSIPTNVIQEDAKLSLLLMDRNLQRNTPILKHSPEHPLLPEIKVVEGCRTFLRPLTYRSDLSGVAIVSTDEGNKQAMRLRWCWGAQDTMEHQVASLSEFFDSNLIVREISSCKKNEASESNSCEATGGEFINVGVRDCGNRGDVQQSYDLEHCVFGAPLTLTPSHYPNDSSTPITWCLENRIFPNPDGSYPQARWAKNEALYLQFKVCENK